MRRCDRHVPGAADERRGRDRRGAGVMLRLVRRLQRRLEHGPGQVDGEHRGRERRIGDHEPVWRGRVGAREGPHAPGAPQQHDRRAGAERERDRCGSRRPLRPDRRDLDRSGREAVGVGPQHETIRRGVWSGSDNLDDVAVVRHGDRASERRVVGNADEPGTVRGRRRRAQAEPQRPPRGRDRLDLHEARDWRDGAQRCRVGERPADPAVRLRPAGGPAGVAGADERRDEHGARQPRGAGHQKG